MGKTFEDFERRCIEAEEFQGTYFVVPDALPEIWDEVAAQAATIDSIERLDTGNQWTEAVRVTNDTGEHIYLLE